MSKKDRVQITRPDDFSEIDNELANAIEQLDETNTRIESLLQAHAAPETDTDAPVTQAVDEGAAAPSV